MTVRTITLYVTGEFQDLDDYKVAGLIFEVLAEDPYTGEGGHFEIKGITLPQEEDDLFDTTNPTYFDVTDITD